MVLADLNHELLGVAAAVSRRTRETKRETRKPDGSVVQLWVRVDFPPTAVTSNSKPGPTVTLGIYLPAVCVVLEALHMPHMREYEDVVKSRVTYVYVRHARLVF
jgi:hypothetical protein